MTSLHVGDCHKPGFGNQAAEILGMSLAHFTDTENANSELGHKKTPGGILAL